MRFARVCRKAQLIHYAVLLKRVEILEFEMTMSSYSQALLLNCEIPKGIGQIFNSVPQDLHPAWCMEDTV